MGFSQNDRIEIFGYQTLINEIKDIKEYFERYKNDEKKQECEVYIQMVAKMKYLKNKEAQISVRTKELYKEFYNINKNSG